MGGSVVYGDDDVKIKFENLEEFGKNDSTDDVRSLLIKIQHARTLTARYRGAL